jgi:hypothetical protein
MADPNDVERVAAGGRDAGYVSAVTGIRRILNGATHASKCDRDVQVPMPPGGLAGVNNEDFDPGTC